MEELTELEKYSLALALFGFAMRSGPPMFPMVQSIAEKVGITDELTKFGLDWISSSKAKRSDFEKALEEADHASYEDSKQAIILLRVIRLSDNTVHTVKKYILDSDKEQNIWCDSWYGRHVIGQDCKWV